MGVLGGLALAVGFLACLGVTWGLVLWICQPVEVPLPPPEQSDYDWLELSPPEADD